MTGPGRPVAPPRPPKRQRRQDSRLNPASWQLGNRRGSSGSRRGTRYGSQSAGTAGRRPTSRPATPDGCIPQKDPMHSRHSALRHNCRSSSPPPTPIRSRARHADRKHSLNSSLPEPSSSVPIRHNSPVTATGSNQNDTVPLSLPAPRTPTPTHSTTDTPPPRLPRQPLHIRLRVIPAHVDDRAVPPAPAPIVRPVPVTASP